VLGSTFPSWFWGYIFSNTVTEPAEVTVHGCLSTELKAKRKTDALQHIKSNPTISVCAITIGIHPNTSRIPPPHKAFPQLTAGNRPQHVSTKPLQPHSPQSQWHVTMAIQKSLELTVGRSAKSPAGSLRCDSCQRHKV
jgi:hypothetical protein